MPLDLRKMKDDPMIQFYMDSVLHSYKVESVIKKLKKIITPICGLFLLN